MNKQSEHSQYSTAWLILVGAVASTFYIYEYIARIMPEAMTDNLMTAFQINAAHLGLLASMFFYGYAIMQIPAGILLDYFKPRILMPTALALAAIATAIFGISIHYTTAMMARLIIGALSAFAYVGALTIGSHWYKETFFAFYAGLVQFLGCIGAIIGVVPVVILNQHMSWRTVTLLIAAIGIIFALLMLMVLRTPSHMVPLKKVKQSLEFTKVFKNPQTWWACFFGFMIWSPVTIFAVLWGVPFFEQAYQIPKIHAANLITLIWVGVALGGPFVGWLSNRIKKRCLPMMICGAIGFISALPIIYNLHMPAFLIWICLFFFGVGSSAQVLSFGVIIDIIPKQAISTAIGLTNMAVILGGVLLQPLVGFILEALWQGHQVDGIHVYSTHHYQIALSMVPIAFAFAFLAGLFGVKETHCQRQY